MWQSLNRVSQSIIQGKDKSMNQNDIVWKPEVKSVQSIKIQE